jgi:hypothetical protein
MDALDAMVEPAPSFFGRYEHARTRTHTHTHTLARACIHQSGGSIYDVLILMVTASRTPGEAFAICLLT